MLKANLFFLYSITTVAIASLILCVFNYNPFDANITIFIYFYSALLISLFGIFTVIAFYTKIHFGKSELIYSLFWPSARQAIFFSLAITVLAVLRGFRLLDLWTGVPIIIVIMLMELFFQNKKVKKYDKR